jgi:hypothetical protein
MTAIREQLPPAGACPDCGEGSVYLDDAYGVCTDCARFWTGADDPDLEFDDTDDDLAYVPTDLPAPRPAA